MSSNHGWISVKERLPEMPYKWVEDDDGEIIATKHSTFVLAASLTSTGYVIYTAQVDEYGRWTDYMDEWIYDEVTHWMPLPDAPVL